MNLNSKEIELALVRVKNDLGNISYGSTRIKRSLNRTGWDVIFRPRFLHRITVRLDSDESLEQAVCELADELQDFAIDSTGQAWPKCPDHEHPLEAELITGQASWVCPQTSEALYPIGQLPKEIRRRN